MIDLFEGFYHDKTVLVTGHTGFKGSWLSIWLLTEHYGGPIQRIVLELKIKRNSLEKTIEDGLRQTWEYMDKAGAVDEGHFIIFDRTPGKPWEEKIWHEEKECNGRKIMVWGM